MVEVEEGGSNEDDEDEDYKDKSAKVEPRNRQHLGRGCRSPKAVLLWSYREIGGWLVHYGIGISKSVELAVGDS